MHVPVGWCMSRADSVLCIVVPEQPQLLDIAFTLCLFARIVSRCNALMSGVAPASQMVLARHCRHVDWVVSSRSL